MGAGGIQGWSHGLGRGFDLTLEKPFQEVGGVFSTAEVLIAIIDGLWWRKVLNPITDTTRYTDTITAFIERLLRPAAKR